MSSNYKEPTPKPPAILNPDTIPSFNGPWLYSAGNKDTPPHVYAKWPNGSKTVIPLRPGEDQLTVGKFLVRVLNLVGGDGVDGE